MAKYDSLHKYLSTISSNRIVLSFERIEKIIGDALPPRAYNLRQWWENSRSHVQARAWLDAGWVVDNKPDFRGQKVNFRKV